MKKVIFSILILFTLFSCKETIPEKPFIVFFKVTESEGNSLRNGDAWFKYYDANRNVFEFIDVAGKYNIGDTIK